MDEEIKPPEAPPRPPPPAPKKGLHGGVAFVLFFPVGIIVGIGMILGAGLVFQSFKYADLATVLCVFLAVALAAFRRWGFAGFVLGMSVPFSFVAMIVAICGGKPY